KFFLVGAQGPGVTIPTLPSRSETPRPSSILAAQRVPLLKTGIVTLTGTPGVSLPANAYGKVTIYLGSMFFPIIALPIPHTTLAKYDPCRIKRSAVVKTSRPQVPWGNAPRSARVSRPRGRLNRRSPETLYTDPFITGDLRWV